MTGCMACGGTLDDLAITLTITFAPGQLGPRHHITEPHQVEGWALCSACWKDNPLITGVLGSGYLKAVLPPTACTVFCCGSIIRRGPRRKFWSPFQGALSDAGEDVGHLRCPVCWGTVRAERKVAA